MTVAQLARTMSEGEFYRWQVYAAKNSGLPHKRMERYMAQVAMYVAASGGAKDLTLSDFLFEPEIESTADDEIAFFDFRPYKKKVQ